MKKRLISWLLGIGLCFAFVLGVALAVPASRAPLLVWFRGERDQAPRGERLHQEKTLEQWVRQLQSDDLDSRHSACFALQYFESEDAVRAVPSLVPLLRSKEDRLRGGAADALGRIGPLARDGLLPLTALLADEKAHVRTYAAEALDLMCTPEAGASIPALVTASKEAVKEEATDEAG